MNKQLKNISKVDANFLKLKSLYSSDAREFLLMRFGKTTQKALLGILIKTDNKVLISGIVSKCF